MRFFRKCTMFRRNIPLRGVMESNHFEDLEKTFAVEVPRQPPTGVLRKRCSENMQQIYRRTLIPKSDFNKFAKQLYWIEITFRHGYSPVRFLHVFRTPFLKNTSGQVLLEVGPHVKKKSAVITFLHYTKVFRTAISKHLKWMIMKHQQKCSFQSRV